MGGGGGQGGGTYKFMLVVMGHFVRFSSNKLISILNHVVFYFIFSQESPEVTKQNAAL